MRKQKRKSAAMGNPIKESPKGNRTKRRTSKAAKDEVLTVDDERDQRKTKEKDGNFGQWSNSC